MRSAIAPKMGPTYVVDWRYRVAILQFIKSLSFINHTSITGIPAAIINPKAARLMRRSNIGRRMRLDRQLWCPSVLIKCASDLPT